MIKIEKNGANGDLAKTVNTRRISKYSFVEETDFRSKMSKSSDGCQFQDVETMFDKITRQVLLRLLKI